MRSYRDLRQATRSLDQLRLKIKNLCKNVTAIYYELSWKGVKSKLKGLRKAASIHSVKHSPVQVGLLASPPSSILFSLWWSALRLARVSAIYWYTIQACKAACKQHQKSIVDPSNEGK